MFHIRDIKKEDHDLFVKLMVGFYGAGAALYEANLAHIERTFAAVMGKSPYLRAVIMEYEGAAVGFALLAFTWSNESGGMVVWLEQLYILPEFQGRQLGSALLRWLTEEYAHFSRIRLEVCPSNPGAKRLYERFGFQTLNYVQMVRDKKE